MTRRAPSLLGPFQVKLDGQSVTDFESNKVRALLGYLALHTMSGQKRKARRRLSSASGVDPALVCPTMTERFVNCAARRARPHPAVSVRHQWRPVAPRA
jgi:hypothetical protein